MYPHQNNSGNGSNSWSIPKKKTSLEGSIPRRKSGGSSNSSGFNSSHQDPMVIPRKSKHPQPSSGHAFGPPSTSSTSSTIPRKPSFTGSIPRRNSGTLSSGSISRRKAGSSLHSSHRHNNNSSNSSQSRAAGNRLSFKIPMKHRMEQSRAYAKNSMHDTSFRSERPSNLSRKHEQLSTALSSHQSSLAPNIISERPFRISINLRGVDLNNDGIPVTVSRKISLNLKREKEKKKQKASSIKSWMTPNRKKT